MTTAFQNIAAGAGTTHKIIGAIKDTTALQRRVGSLIIANTLNGSIGIKVYLAVDGTGATPTQYIVGGASTYLKMGQGYTADIFQGTPFEYPATHELYVVCDHISNSADIIINYDIIDKM